VVIMPVVVVMVVVLMVVALVRIVHVPGFIPVMLVGVAFMGVVGVMLVSFVGMRATHDYCPVST